MPLLWSFSIRDSCEEDAPNYAGLYSLTQAISQRLTCSSQIYKKRIRRLRFVSRIASTILSGYMIGSISFSLAQYYLTKNNLVPGTTQRAWADPILLWPSFMLLGVSSLTFIINLITMCAYICSVKAANRTSSLATYVGYAGFLAHFISWAVVTGLFEMASKEAHDLWGYSCSTTADAIAENVQSFVNFEKLCTIQVKISPLLSSLH